MFALLQKYTPDGPLVVHELFAEDPELAPSLKVVDVSAVPGIVAGWVQNPDGGFGPYVPALEDAKADRVRGLRFDCFHAIIGGFTSDALGKPHRYGSSDTDQANLDRAAVAALIGGDDFSAQVPCADEPDRPAFVAHSAKQLHQVVTDLHAMIEAARVKRDALNAKIEAATTVDAVQAIVWG